MFLPLTNLATNCRQEIILTKADAGPFRGTKSKYSAFVGESTTRFTMPSKSAQQHRFMEAAAHNPAFAEKAGIPQKVAKEFVDADKRAAKKAAAKKKPAKKRASTRKRTKTRG